MLLRGDAPLPWHEKGYRGERSPCVYSTEGLPGAGNSAGRMRPRSGCVGWGTWLRLGSENLWVIISAVSWGLACFPAVSGTGKGRQYRDVIREGGDSRWKYQVQVAKQCVWPCQTGSELLWGWEERGGGEANPKGSALARRLLLRVRRRAAHPSQCCSGTGWHRCIPHPQHIPVSPSRSGGELCCQSQTSSC